MTVVPLPAGAAKVFETATITLRRGSILLRSPYTGRRQVLLLPFALWSLDVTLVELDQPEAAPWRSFLAELEGQANTFRLPVPGVSGPVSGYSGPKGVVSVADQTGKVLVTSGWTPGATILKKGDYLTVNDELKLVKLDVVASGGGAATIQFQPPLRSKPPLGSEIEIYAPTVLMSAVGDDVASWKVRQPVRHAFELKAIEAVGIGE